jgi:putative endonuclease
MSWFLYLIECRDGSIYTGIAVDVYARYAAHEKGKGARYTRSHPPRRLLAIVEYADRSTASKAEYAMKRLSAADKRTFCLQRDVLWTLDFPRNTLHAKPAQRVGS